VFCNNAAALVALVANGTVPVTLAPAKEVKLAPDPTNKLADITLAPVKLPPVPPPNVTVPLIFALADIVSVLALITLAPVKLPPVPPPNITLPVMFAVPATFMPVPVTITTFALPAELKLIFPFADGMLTLLVPLLIFELLPLAIPVN